MTVIALTGVTGHLGGMIADKFAKTGLVARYLARRPEAAPKHEGCEVYRSSYEHSQETVMALTGVDVLLMVSAAENDQRLQQHKAFIDAAKEAGVKQIIYTSFYNAKANSTFTLGRDHAATEDYIKENGFTYTFIRDNFYTDFFVEIAKNYQEIKGPAGDGKVSAVVREDVADVIAKVLTEPAKWENQVLNMTGPEDLSLGEIAEQVSEATGIAIPYIEETIPQAYESRKAWPAPDWQYDAWVSTYTAIAVGERAGVSNDVERVLGRNPRSLKDYLTENS